LGPAFQSIRAFPVAGFKSILVFYRTREDVLEIVRVLHGARDLEALFRKESVDGAEQ
jgi:toxin ParE1/3/4